MRIAANRALHVPSAFLTFYGVTRASEDSINHIHESPKSITIPLILLAVLSVTGGFMGVPEALGGSHWLQGFLNPVFASSRELVEAHHLSHSTEYMLMGIVIVLTFVILGFTYSRYVVKNHVPVPEDKITGSLQRTLYNKYYVDQLYDLLIVKPLYWMADKFDRVVEQLGIDAVVNAAGNTVVGGSKIARLLQNGRIGYYIFIMVIGVVFLLGYAIVR